MRSTIIVAATMAVLASAQLPTLPSCVQNCLLPVVAADGCSLTDFACHCKNTGLVSQVTPCTSKCSCSDQAAGASALTSLCASNNNPIQIPAQASCGASSAAASSTAAASSAASSAAASASSAVASAKSSASAAASSAASSAAASASASASGSAPAYSAAANPQVTQAAGLMGAAMLAMFL